MKGPGPRVTTAIIFVSLMLLSLVLGPRSFILTFGTIGGLCLWEYQRLVLNQEDQENPLRILLIMTIGLYPYIMACLHFLDIVQFSLREVIIVNFLFLLLIMSSFLLELFGRSKQPIRNTAFQVLGTFYIGIPFTLLQFVAFIDQSYDYIFVLGFMVIMWLNDTGAYAIGSIWGKTKLMERISPKKTWEGTIGGLVIAVLVGYLLSLLFWQLPTIHWMALGFIIGLFGTLGDLVESMMKRHVGTKDSGELLPGHGGFLDRFDSFIFMLPFATTYLVLVH